MIIVESNDLKLEVARKLLAKMKDEDIGFGFHTCNPTTMYVLGRLCTP